jgi:hypothetical protein
LDVEHRKLLARVKRNLQKDYGHRMRQILDTGNDPGPELLRPIGDNRPGAGGADR